ncbi:MAG: shikimate dehydrogenase [Candidatus Omnitrophica bacterium]|nr:shikimate dehydrogenase [Candidatus Omnitrophota bacterium]
MGRHKIDANTIVCISIAARPGNFGAHFHNTAYSLLGLNYLYIPRKIESAMELKSAISSVRALGIGGCSVSMPHKESVIKYLDGLDRSAERIGSVNTIKRLMNGSLRGYNTDYYGAKRALRGVNIKGKEVLMVGAGGVAKAIGLAVKELGGRLTIANRTYEKAKKIGGRLKANVISWKELNHARGYLLINATSVGMRDPASMIVPKEVIARFEVVKDVVLYPEQTKLLKEAKKLGKQIIPGTLMCAYQAAKQFNIYTGLNAPKEVISKILRGC